MNEFEPQPPADDLSMEDIREIALNGQEIEMYTSSKEEVTRGVVLRNIRVEERSGEEFIYAHAAFVYAQSAELRTGIITNRAFKIGQRVSLQNSSGRFTSGPITEINVLDADRSWLYSH